MIDEPDPLTALRGDELPVAPDPAFAARLRGRLESALTLPHHTRGVQMSGTDTAIGDLNNAEAAVAGMPRPAALPYLSVRDARTAIDWYVHALGATLLGDPIVMDDGRVGHAELSIGAGVLYLADEFPEMGLKAPAPQSVSVSLMLQVPDTDAALLRAAGRGATVERQPYEAHGSRTATIIDPSGHRWMLTGPVTGAAVSIQHGDVGVVSICTPDTERAATFYGRVLGWEFDAAADRVTNTATRITLSRSAGTTTMRCCYAVDDLAGTRQAIISGGGAVGVEAESGYGTTLDATDPSGAPFAVYRPAPGTPRPELNGTGPGDLSYITYHAQDSAAFRAFYSRFLFWTFDTGRVADGWEIQGAHPMAGMVGGQDRPAAVPMWTVTDIDAATERVRAAGGTIVDEPSTQSYGRSALCTDDQGSVFYLGEL
ncbi:MULTISPECIES: VOC family protein [Mycobacteriaceae]|uniref:Glyoxalase n=1 Tax=Mycolicibacterium neoaurum VKM Ac-1815D TaxID=700508 RepID=V5X994_MYCNE|nr:MULTISPECIES: VOC family protein [Mycobacteriaceae]AHC24266.1 glyoxalase [Mycolicibacterium neoaurum VKM Ac-1815D]AMO04879.1 glyoxalase [Mycolicibacterium neoaurum]AXK76812.1 glyoxalase [Mycolicibacterium neoaurum]KJQ51986.1 glyoxalase [Mycolicibacterium neoaurum]KUM10231.1 glyoxalase [Mycolicibacterium neoaurum]